MDNLKLMAYSNTKIDYEYIINLIQNIVTANAEEGGITPEKRQKKINVERTSQGKSESCRHYQSVRPEITKVMGISDNKK